MAKEVWEKEGMYFDYFEFLGVTENSSLEDIKRNYHKLIKMYHPDANNEATKEEFLKANAAYETITNKEKREKYLKYREQKKKESNSKEESKTINFSESIKEYQKYESMLIRYVNIMLQKIEEKYEKFIKIYNDFCIAIKTKSLSESDYEVRRQALHSILLSSLQSLDEIKKIIEKDLKKLNLKQEHKKIKDYYSKFKDCEKILTSSYKQATYKVNISFKIRQYLNKIKRNKLIYVIPMVSALTIFGSHFLGKELVEEVIEETITDDYDNEFANIEENEIIEETKEEIIETENLDSTSNNVDETTTNSYSNYLVSNDDDIYFKEVPQKSNEVILEYLSSKFNEIKSDSNDYATPTFDEMNAQIELENYLFTINYNEFASLIDSSNIDTLYKDIIKEIIKENPSLNLRYYIAKLLISDSDEMINESLYNIFDDAYNGIYSSSSGDYEYPIKNMRVLNNLDGELNLPKQMFLYCDVSTFGKYNIYNSDLNDDYFGNIIISDNEDNLLLYFTIEKITDYKYVYHNHSISKGIKLTPVKNMLEENELGDEAKDIYEDINSIRKLSFNLSYKLNKNDNTLNPNVLILNVPEQTGSWYTSNNGEYNSYYFMLKVNDYLFLNDTSIYVDINNPNALIFYQAPIEEYSKFRYIDDAKKVFINCNSGSEHFINYDNFVEMVEKAKNEQVELELTKSKKIKN